MGIYGGHMEAKQVFKTYDYENVYPEYKYAFCVICGNQYTDEEESGRLRKVCKYCGNIHYRNPSPAVSVLVMEDNKVLLCKRNKGSFQGGKWCLPCGYIEYDEDFLSAAIREVKEETGLDVTILSTLSVVSYFFEIDLHTIVVVLLAQRIGGKVKVGGDTENDAIEWISIHDGLPEMAFEADTHIIERYIKTGLIGTPVDPNFAMIQ